MFRKSKGVQDQPGPGAGSATRGGNTTVPLAYVGRNRHTDVFVPLVRLSRNLNTFIRSCYSFRLKALFMCSVYSYRLKPPAFNGQPYGCRPIFPKMRCSASCRSKQPCLRSFDSSSNITQNNSFV
jgi:hypothetical protein